MKTTLLILLFFCFCMMPLPAQTSEKLPANTVIGTVLSVNYSDNASPSTTVNTIANAFDGDLNTFFASYVRSGTWVGLDLGEEHIITKIAYAPRSRMVEGSNRLLLGVFEGASDPDFLDAVPLLMITELPAADTLTAQDVNCSKGFRYVRYVGPNNARCNIAEIEFYGYKGKGDNSFFPQLTNLPVISIQTVGAQAVRSRDYYIDGFITIIYNDGKSLFHDGMGIRGRGHGSWTFPKKPYRIKLLNKVNLLGFPARERNWTLIPNYGDKTLMRNLLAFDLSRRLEMVYTSVGISVDVIFNGEYQGTYQLSDQLEVAPGRVEVEEMTVDDITPPGITGGYLLEVDGYAYVEENWFESAGRTPVRVRYPKDDEIVPEQFDYIRDHYNKMENAVFAANFRDPVNGYRKYFDEESFIRHFLVGEISGNTDTYWSTYLYKEREDDRFRFGPVWDFDLAYENDERTYPINENSRWVFQYGTTASGFRDLVNRLLEDEPFVQRMKEIYEGYRKSGILTKEVLLQVVDDYAEELNQSQHLNFMRWDIMNLLIQKNPVIFDSYEEEVNNVKRYISDRIDWMDHKFNDGAINSTPHISGFSNIAVYSKQKAISFENIAETVTVTIVDVTGRVIVSKSISHNESIPVAEGLYFVTVTGLKAGRISVKCLVSGR